MKQRLVDFSDPILSAVLFILLKDRTTGKNIIWATEPPSELGAGFTDEITLEQMLCNKLEKFDRHDWKAILDQSIYAGWQDIYALKQDDQYEQSTEMEFPRL